MRVVHNRVAFEQGVVTVEIRPQATPKVVMNVVVACHGPHCPHELDRSSLPIHLKSEGTVVRYLVALYERITTYSADAELTIVMNVVVNNTSTVPRFDADPMIEANLIPNDQPVRAAGRVAVVEAGIDRAML